MKKIIILSCLFVTCIFSCSKKLYYEQNAISFDSSKLDGSCGSGFTINKKREPDDFFRKELEQYLYKAFIDYKDCKVVSKELFNRRSFKEIVLEVYTDSSFVKYSIYESESRWKESYIKLLLNCTNEKVFYALCDSLLLRNIDDGILAVWDKDATRLHYIKRFAAVNNNNFYQLAELIAVCHNSKMWKERDFAVVQIKKLDNQKSEPLIRLLQEDKKIEYTLFMETMYGGM